MKSTHHSVAKGITTILAASFLGLAAYASIEVPTPKKTVAPRFNAYTLDLEGEVRVKIDINEYGFVTNAAIESSTDSTLDQMALDAVYQWTFNPATDDGHPLASKAIQPFYFNHGSIVMEEKAKEDTLPKIKKRVSPDLSEDLENITGQVVLSATLNEDGGVSAVEIKSSTHSELEKSAAFALRQWQFKPATKAGKPVASKIVIPFNYTGKHVEEVVAQASEPVALDRAPVPVRQPSPELTAALSKEQGVAKLKMAVDEHGYVANVEVIESTSETLARLASEAALQWKFKPAIKNGKTVASLVLQPFTFSGDLVMADLPVDRMPSIKNTKQPLLPKELEGVKGFVRVRLNLDARGNVVSAASTKSSHDELVGPTLEAAKLWKFKPAIRDGAEVPSAVVVPFLFNEQS